jgi:hypothetical protein
MAVLEVVVVGVGVVARGRVAVSVTGSAAALPVRIPAAFQRGHRRVPHPSLYPVPFSSSSSLLARTLILCKFKEKKYLIFIKNKKVVL